MRLSSIKLSGFKSFINSEHISFTKNLCVIVGPNGCGKSNIVDAIRWVLGEGSARHLRGDAMADVIFSGSDARPPAARAYVELVFDNSDGRIQNQFASYAEISIARQLTTDGISRFFLNGQSCRRRDITDIFSGTGLGPRGYSVVEQGTIANLIEASPEALRVQLEEAAGISKYKARRRETEIRMRHTRDNMNRITDINQETASQAAHLKQQSEIAGKYRKLKTELNLVHAKALYLQWRDLNNNQTQIEQQIRKQDAKLDKASADYQHLNLNAETKQTKYEDCVQKITQAQAQDYETRSAITSFEADIRSQEQQLQQLTDALTDKQNRIKQIDAKLGDDDGKAEDLQNQLTAAAKALEVATAESITKKDALTRAEKAMSEWQSQWDLLQQKHNKAQQSQSEKAFLLKQTTAIMDHLKQQIAELKSESEAPEQAEYKQNNDSLNRQISTANTELTKQAKTCEKFEAERLRLNQKLQDDVKQLHELRLGLEKMLGEQASTETWLTNATATTDEPSKIWHTKAGLDAANRLSQNLAVPAKWRTAVELVLGSLLSGLVVEDLGALSAKLNTVKDERITLIENHQTQLPKANSNLELPTLSEQLDHPHPASKLLQFVYVANNNNTALGKRHLLKDHESIITAECFWVSPLWVRTQADVAASDIEQSGVLESTARLAKLKTAIKKQQQAIHKADATFAKNNTKNELVRQQLEQSKEVLLNLRTDKADLEANQKAYELQNKEQTKRNIRTSESLAKLTAKYTEEQTLFSQTGSELEAAKSQVSTLDVCLAELVETRAKLVEDLDVARQAQDGIQKQRHEKELAYQGYAIESENRLAEKTSLATQHSETVADLERLNTKITAIHPKIDNLKTELQDKLALHSKQEQELSKLRKNSEELRHQLQEINTGKNEAAENIELLRGELEKLRIEHKGYETNQAGFEQQLEAAGHTKAELDKQIGTQDSESKLSNKANSLEARINRLGAINMAAADEYDAALEKQHYLDRQLQDLKVALATLDDAIAQIDQETSTRFKSVCTDVNTHLNKYFGKFFGGGTAKLEMTTDDLLETGLVVMARPPGKKNNSIKLLSGGEKSLTALALVFALFELNPAPLCVLDEVDAALDDANLQRYAKVLREMSENIQFIYVSHNKSAVDAAEQLIGITMQESGVSRLVAVNLEETIAAIAQQ